MEINVHPIHPRPTPLPHIVRQTPHATNTDANRTHRAPNLLIEKGLNVGLAGEHLHGRARALNLLGAARPRDEQEYFQNIPSLGLGENGRHPRPDPLQVLGRLDDPDEYDLARRDGAIAVARDEVADVRDLVGDSDACGEQQHCAVGMQGLATIRSFEKSRGGEFSGCRVFGFLPETIGEAGAAADDEGHSRLAHLQDVLTGERKFLHGHVVLFFAPCHGERMVRVEADGRHVDVSVLAGLEAPWASQLHGYANSVAR